MKEKKWIDCPVCGMKGMMRKRREMKERRHPPGYPPLDIEGLDGQFCKSCHDGFWSRRSGRKLTKEVVEHMAKYDAARVVAAELASVREAAQALKVTVQAVHKMMDEGRMRYVRAGGYRLPLRKELKAQEKAPRRRSRAVS